MGKRRHASSSKLSRQDTNHSQLFTAPSTSLDFAFVFAKFSLQPTTCVDSHQHHHLCKTIHTLLYPGQNTGCHRNPGFVSAQHSLCLSRWGQPWRVGGESRMPSYWGQWGTGQMHICYAARRQAEQPSVSLLRHHESLMDWIWMCFSLPCLTDTVALTMPFELQEWGASFTHQSGHPFYGPSLAASWLPGPSFVNAPHLTRDVNVRLRLGSTLAYTSHDTPTLLDQHSK